MSERAIKTVRGGRDLIGNGWVDDGYEWMEQAAAEGWRAVSAWGRDGWDFGDWPYVVYLFRERVVDDLQADEIAAGQPHPSRVTQGGGVTGIGSRVLYERASYCEGDCEILTYASEQDRSDDADESALFYWVGNGESWAEGLTRETTADEMPEHLRGPYTRARCQQEELRRVLLDPASSVADRRAAEERLRGAAPTE